MTDLTAIKTPFGLLDRETQEALKAHGGPWEYYDECLRWETTYKPHWVDRTVYRAKHAPPKPRERWSVGECFRQTEAEAQAFLSAVQEENPGLDFGPIRKWREVLPE